MKNMSIQNLLPAHLRQILLPDSEALPDDGWICGKLHCPCGSETFRVKTFADTSPEKFIRVTPHQNGFALAVTAECTVCGKEWLIFDYAMHGYEAVVCGMGVQSCQEQMERRSCPECAEDAFAVRISIETEDPEDFVHELGCEGFSTEDAAEAFSWITMELTCTNCRRETPGWLDLETS